MTVPKYHFTLAEAMNLAPDEVSIQRDAWPHEVFDQAVEHHTKRNLRANTLVGASHDVDGFVSKFVDYDWETTYQTNPSQVYCDFFRPRIGNSCNRIMRGLTP